MATNKIYYRTRQERRAYHRIISGIKKHKGELMRFLTLTTSRKLNLGQLNYSFVLLTSRIRRLTPLNLLRQGWISYGDYRYFYHSRNNPLRFDYFKVKVADEGVDGVIHILFFGDYIPQQWISSIWEKLTGAYIVDIRATKKKVDNVKRLTNYVISQYVINQEGGKRFSWSANWVFKGFVKFWKQLVKSVDDIHIAIDIWDKMLSGGLAFGHNRIYLPIF